MPPTAVLKGKALLNGSQFQRGLKGLNRSVARFGRTVGAPVARAVGGMVKIGSVATIVAAGGYALAIRASAKYGDTLDKMSKRMRFSTEELARLGHAAELSGASLDAVEKASARSQVAINDAGDGLKTYTRLFDDLKISIKELEQLSPEQQFEKLLIAVAETENSTLRTTAAMKLFGRAGRSLLPMLSEGAEGLKRMKEEADTLGLVISKDQAEEAARFVDEVTRLKGAFKGLAIQGVQLGGLSDTINKMTGAVVRFRKSATFDQMKNGIKNFVNNSINFIRKLIITWGSLSDQSKKTFTNVLKVGAAFVLALKTGVFGAMLTLMNTFLLAFPAFGSAIALMLIGLGAFIVGLKLGKKIEDSFNLSGFLVQFQIFANAFIDGFMAMGSNLVAGAAVIGRQVLGALINPLGSGNAGADITNAFDAVKNQINTEMDNIKNNMETKMADAMKFDTADQTFDNRFDGIGKKFDALVNKFKGVKTTSSFAKAIKEAFDTFSSIKLEDLSLSDALGVGDANAGIDDMKNKLESSVDRIRKIGGTIGGLNLNAKLTTKDKANEMTAKATVETAKNTKEQLKVTKAVLVRLPADSPAARFG